MCASLQYTAICAPLAIMHKSLALYTRIDYTYGHIVSKIAGYRYQTAQREVNISCLILLTMHYSQGYFK